MSLLYQAIKELMVLLKHMNSLQGSNIACLQLVEPGITHAFIVMLQTLLMPMLDPAIICGQKVCTGHTGSAVAELEPLAHCAEFQIWWPQHVKDLLCLSSKQRVRTVQKQQGIDCVQICQIFERHLLLVQAAAIHGDVSQSLRTQAMDDFKAGTQPLLIATDVAARGLDVPDVSVVINFSFPLTTEDYVHRIGRTGRAGKSGGFCNLLCKLHVLMLIHQACLACA